MPLSGTNAIRPNAHDIDADLGHDDQVAGQREPHPGANGRTVDGGHDGLRTSAERVDQRVVGTGDGVVRV